MLESLGFLGFRGRRQQTCCRKGLPPYTIPPVYRTDLFCSVLFCSVLFCSVLFCSVLFCSVLFCSVEQSVLCCAPQVPAARQRHGVLCGAAAPPHQHAARRGLRGAQHACARQQGGRERGAGGQRGQRGGGGVADPARGHPDLQGPLRPRLAARHRRLRLGACAGQCWRTCSPPRATLCLCMCSLCCLATGTSSAF